MVANMAILFTQTHNFFDVHVCPLVLITLLKSSHDRTATHYSCDVMIVLPRLHGNVEHLDFLEQIG